MEYAARKQYKQAVREWQLGVEQDPTYPRCHEHLGDFAMRVGHPGEAVAAYRNAARLDSTDGPLLLKLANAEQIAGDTKTATDTAQRATRLLPNSADAFYLYGRLASIRGHSLEALTAFRHAQKLRPDDPVIVKSIVAVDLDIPDLASAERDLTPYLETHPADPEACYQMARIYNLKPRTPANLTKALNYARSALAGMPRNPQVYSLLGQLYRNAGQPVEALRVYQQGFHKFPNDESILHGLVDVFQGAGDTQAATYMASLLKTVGTRHSQIAHLKDVVDFNPTDVKALLQLGRLEEEDDNLPMAELFYVQMVRQAPNDPRTRPALASFLRRTGRPALAAKVMQPDFMP